VKGSDGAPGAGNVGPVSREELLKLVERGYFHEPTIFTGVTPRMTIFREEIFGPVLVVTAFDTEDEAVAAANDTDYGLSAGVWTTSLSKALRVSSRLEAGAIWVNTWFASLDSAAGGGRKLSGVGVEGGVPGLEEFTVVKHVAVSLSDEPCGYYPAKD
jgi:acyl-CoA reductase-like NAD-dependent aldehyde dehydrogenase